MIASRIIYYTRNMTYRYQEAREWFSHALSCVKDMRLMFDDDDVTSVYEVVDACASTIEKLCLVLKGVYTLGSSQSKFLYSI
jgi:hypothetical protein